MTTNNERKAGKRGTAREDPATVGGRVLGTRDLAVVGGHDRAGEIEESGSGISNGIDRGGNGRAATDSVGRRLELPESIGSAYARVNDVASVFA